MPTYLAEDEVGFDAGLISFPNLGGCMAVVLVTDQGLFGFHITPGNTRRSNVFDQFIKNTRSSYSMRRLYGSCYWANRYQGSLDGSNQRTQWQREMTEIANALGYHGVAGGFDLSSATSHADKTMKVTDYGTSHKGVNYLEYMLKPDGQSCRIYYKKQEKVLTTQSAASPHGIQKISGGNLTTPPKFTASVQVVAKPGKSGKMHEVGLFGMHTFTIP